MRLNPVRLLLLASALASCSDNYLATGEAKDPAEDAALALERGDEDKAIDILESALTDDPDNANYLSVLSAAYAQRAGVEPLTIAQGMATSSSDDDGADDTSQSGLIAMFDIMPDATAQGLVDIDYAIVLIGTIPSDLRTAGDVFKFAIYQTASMVLHLKILDTDKDGDLSLDEITSLSDSSALGILTQLATATAILAGDADSATTAKAAESLARYQTQIDAAEGATQEEKLRNYMAQSQAKTLR